MYLDKLTVTTFRNYDYLQTRFSPHLNLIYGLNAQGKTNLLEAIYLLCLGRSFRLAKNQELIKSKDQSFIIEGKIILDNKIEKKTVLRYIKDGRKEISIDRKKLTKHSNIFGQFPVVVMAPDEFKITSGGPSERRKFLDILLSQISLTYLANLQEYNRILKQRNKILQLMFEGQKVQESALDPWTQRLAEIGKEVINYRNEFLREFSEKLKVIYKDYTKSKDKLDLLIESTIKLKKEMCKVVDFVAAIDRVSKKERILGTTLVGPHRDDLVFQINGMDLRKFGSRGEHKSVLVAVKIAEYKYLKAHKSERPIILLDDCYSELDSFREDRIFKSLNDLGQIFITSPQKNIFDRVPPQLDSDRISRFSITQGIIEYAN